MDLKPFEKTISDLFLILQGGPVLGFAQFIQKTCHICPVVHRVLLMISKLRSITSFIFHTHEKSSMHRSCFRHSYMSRQLMHHGNDEREVIDNCLVHII